MPRHINPGNRQEVATAPYNFVPLPNAVFTVDDGIENNGQRVRPWQMHDRFDPDLHSGWIDLSITTLTPLFIRGPATRQNGRWEDREPRLRPDPFMTKDGKPMIPGSSLRGMIRNLMEIMAFAKIPSVTTERPFFRDMSPGRIANEYRKHFIRELGRLQSGKDIASNRVVPQSANGYHAKVKAGIIEKNGDGWNIRECGLARVEQRLLESFFGASVLIGRGPMAMPNWAIHNQEVYVRVDANEENYFFEKKLNRNGRPRHPDLYLRFRKVDTVDRTNQPGLSRGKIVLTGGIMNKHLEFVFLTDEPGATVPIPEEKLKRFHDQDQVTQWQEGAFPKDAPTRSCRKNKGWLRDGEPVFFLLDDTGGLDFFGRAQMFRYPYDLSPYDLIPKNLKTAGLDLVEALFGIVSQGQTGATEAIKGRVFFEDAIAQNAGPEAVDKVMVPQILSSPNVTSFQHYLTQDGSQDRRGLTTYLRGDGTMPRGFKLYWHPDEQKRSAGARVADRQEHDRILRELQSPDGGDSNTQHTIIRPVKKNVVFDGKIRFENLTKVELGALLACLNLPEGCAHKIGMAKPLGLGSIRIESRLHTLDRTARYGSWNASGEKKDDVNGFVSAFTDEMLRHAGQTSETIITGNVGLSSIARLDALYTMLSFADAPPMDKVQIMDVGLFKRRNVLPTPHRVAGKQEPNWPSDPPRAGSSPPGHRGQQGRGGANRGRGGQQQHGRDGADRGQGGQQQYGQGGGKSRTGWPARP